MEIQRVYNKVQSIVYIPEQKDQIRFSQKTSKRACTVLKKKIKKSLNQMKTRWTCMIMVGREKCGEGEKGFVIQSMPHCLSAHYVQMQQRLSPGQEIR